MKEDAQEQLRVIYEMIENAKDNFREGGFYYLLWGWLVLISSLLSYVLLELVWQDGRAFLVWPVLMSAGFVISFWKAYRSDRQSRMRSHITRSIQYLWVGFTISLLMMLAAFLFRKMPAETTYPIFIIFYGLGAFVSGGLLRFRPLVVGGLLSWGIAAIAFIVPFRYQLLLMALSVAVAWLAPGYLLNGRKR
jgi:hypothetical protein